MLIGFLHEAMMQRYFQFRNLAEIHVGGICRCYAMFCALWAVFAL